MRISHLVTVFPTTSGYVIICRCGWGEQEIPTVEEAMGIVHRHKGAARQRMISWGNKHESNRRRGMFRNMDY